MNLFALPSIIAFAVEVFLGVFVYYRNPKYLLNRLFLIFTLLAAYSTLAEYGYRSAHNYETAVFWFKFNFLWPIPIAVSVHFILIFIGHFRLLKTKLTHAVIYIPAVVFSYLLLFTNKLYESPVHMYWGWYQHPQRTIVVGLCILWILILLISAIYLCIRYIMNTTSYRVRQQTKIILAGFSFPYLFGIISEIILPSYELLIPELTTLGLLSGSIFIAHGIWKYELFSLTPEVFAGDILSTMTDALFLVGPDGKIVLANRAISSLIDEEAAAMKGLKLSSLLTDSDEPLEGGINIIQMIRQRGAISDHEMFLLIQKGDTVPVSVSASVLRDKQESIVGYVVVVRNITERKQAEMALHKAYDELERRVEDRTSQLLEANAQLKREIKAREIAEEERACAEARLQQAAKMEAIGTLAGGVAHDLNNILSGIVSYPDLLLYKLPKNSPLRKPILTIKDSGIKASEVVQDLLTLARRGVIRETVINLNHVIAEYFNSPEYKKLKSHHPGVEIITRLKKDLLNIMGSPVHLSKTVMNLIDNAAESMPNGGEIIVSTENRYIDGPITGYKNFVQGIYIVLTVSDTGIGISSKDIGKIFEPFYTKKAMGRSGTGLGMAVVWGTVKDHKGYITIQSEEGKGSTFTLYFPMTREELVQAKEGISIGDYVGNGETILVVDDVWEQREITAGILKELGYNVTAVSSGREAVEYLKKNTVDLLIVDMIMDSDIDGLETYRRILEFHPGQKAIIASGFSESDRVKEALKLGAGAYVKKPYTIEKIGMAVKAELKK